MQGRPDLLAIGRIGRPHGVNGEVRIEVLTDFPEERFYPGATPLLGPESGAHPRPVAISGVRRHLAWLLVSLEGVTDRDAAGELSGLFLYVPRDQAHALADDEFYVADLVDLEVVTQSGQVLGRVASLIETGTADVLVVEGGPKTVLIPLLGDIIRSVDLEVRRIVVEPLPGLLD
jgi:16S rRNA processing protein RimM